VPFPDLVAARVCRPAGMSETGFFRSDSLPERTAVGYVTVDGSDRANVFHLPARGSGDGGIFSTVADIAALWRSFFAGRIVSDAWVAEMVRPRSETADGPAWYGLGFWLRPPSPVVFLEGCDAGVSFRSVLHPVAGITHTVVSNSTDGAWPVTRLLDGLLGT
jgi:CubicO group peptidase (beta-lactamase class C family)